MRRNPRLMERGGSEDADLETTGFGWRVADR